MKEKHNDVCSSVVFFLFGVFIFVGSYWIPATTSDILGSRFFPRAVAILIGILSLMQLVSALGELKQMKAAGVKEEKEEKKLNKPFILTTVALFAYYLLVLGIGFTLTSILYLLFEGVVLMRKDEVKDKKKMIILVLVAVIVPVFLNTVFWNVFSIKLPEGALFY
ncbi:tripartite tricarboxylate transporter TctB family protein [Clostridium sp. AF32-12BH]|uniref:tripartite tricarboxylate transporter TctB family protein n=1 Tax=Clostridium sp. AF32-12BH TaxID=2292006 RepID=UPI000E51E56E|nr:tripartite tricarboxylate transporter TctB family protein [Clostridium sp. AF32-12BH]RHP49582.1 tripartite tricarboxylate transporter TctB family protein [Clostridium sp. AF32-12BH]